MLIMIMTTFVLCTCSSGNKKRTRDSFVNFGRCKIFYTEASVYIQVKLDDASLVMYNICLLYLQ